MENRLVVLLGPTAVGKTEVAIQLAESLHSPIINADSRQIYRHIPIGTAAPTAEQLQRVHHYFVGALELEEYYSAAEYEHQVLALLDTLFRQHHDIVLSGGSMLYIDAVCNGIDDIPTIDSETRQTLKERLAAEGLDTLLAELRLLDPDYYAKVDRRNTRRVVHALEVCYQSGRPYSSFLSRQANPANSLEAEKPQDVCTPRPFSIIKIGLNRPRPELFARINQRVDQMLQLGFEHEARTLYPLRHLNSLNTVGYKEMFRYIAGEWTLQQAVEKIKRNTRVYAKKQLTWFMRDPSVRWFHPDDIASIQEYLLS